MVTSLHSHLILPYSGAIKMHSFAIAISARVPASCVVVLLSSPSSSWRCSNHKTCCMEVVTVSDLSCYIVRLRLCFGVLVFRRGCLLLLLSLNLLPRRSGDDGHDHQNLLPPGNLGNPESESAVEDKKTACFSGLT